MLPWLAHCVSPFCLGCLGRLSLRACHSSFSWFRLAEDRIVVGNASWQLGLSLLILGFFFLLGVGLGLCMKWAGAAEFFGPTIAPQNPTVSSGGDEGFDVLEPSSWLVKSYPSLVSKPFRLSKARFWCFDIWGTSSLNSSDSVLPLLDGVMVIQQ